MKEKSKRPTLKQQLKFLQKFFSPKVTDPCKTPFFCPSQIQEDLHVQVFGNNDKIMSIQSCILDGFVTGYTFEIRKGPASRGIFSTFFGVN